MMPEEASETITEVNREPSGSIKEEGAITSPRKSEQERFHRPGGSKSQEKHRLFPVYLFKEHANEFLDVAAEKISENNLGSAGYKRVLPAVHEKQCFKHLLSHYNNQQDV